MKTANGQESNTVAHEISDCVVRGETCTGLAIVLIGLAFLLCPGCGSGGEGDGTGPLLALLLIAAVWGVGLAIRATLRLRRAEALAAEREVVIGQQAVTLESERNVIRNLLRSEVQARQFAVDDAVALDACARLLDGKPGEREWEAAREALRATGRLVKIGEG
jgi:hypothetical protein